MARHTKPTPSINWPDFYQIYVTHKDAPYVLETGLMTRSDVIHEIHDGQVTDVLCVLKISAHAPREDVTEDICEAIGDMTFNEGWEPFVSLQMLLDRYDVDYFRERDNERALRYVGTGL
jgi:hypothetical protein